MSSLLFIIRRLPECVCRGDAVSQLPHFRRAHWRLRSMPLFQRGALVLVHTSLQCIYRQTLITWPHCLASALSWLHANGRHHGAIRLSNIQVDDHFQVFLGQFDDPGVLGTHSKVDYIEAYQYAAPVSVQCCSSYYCIWFCSCLIFLLKLNSY